MSKDDWYFAISTVIGLVALLGIDWKLVAGRVSVSNRKRQIFLLVLIMLSLVSNVLSWRKLHQLHERIPYADFFSPANQMGAINTWGGAEMRGGQWTTKIVVDGEAIISYKDDFKVAGVAFHNYGNVDVQDISELSKSNLYDIVPVPIPMQIEFSKKYVEDASHGAAGTGFRALLIPNKVRLDQFSTIRQAESMGAITIGHAAGPP